MELSIHVAAVLGPVLMVVTVSEFLNFAIWKKVDPTVVYLNGLFLFVGGLILLRLHHRWTPDWTVMITLLSWLLLLAGMARMFFPKAPQPQQRWSSQSIMLILFLSGAFLTFKAYL